MVNKTDKKGGSEDLSEKTKAATLASDFKSFNKALKDFAITVGEPCPEGHRKDPRSGACLPIGGQDHTAFTRSVNNDYGPEWRGEVTKPNLTFDSQNKAATKEVALDADLMDDRDSCTEGNTFSFLKRICVSMEEAEAEDNDQYEYSEEADTLTPSEEPRMKQPEGRRDTPNHECPPDHVFDYKRRKCIPLNKDTVLKDGNTTPDTMGDAVMCGKEERIAAIAHMNGVAKTGRDPLDGHVHFVTVDGEGNGTTAVADGYCGGKSYPHSHPVKGYEVQEWESEDGDCISRHFGMINPQDMEDDDDDEETELSIANPQENVLNDSGVPDPMGDGCHGNPQGDMGPGTYDEYDRFTVMTQPDNYIDSYPVFGGVVQAKQQEYTERAGLKANDFGVPGKRKFPLHDANHVMNAMARFTQADDLSPEETSILKKKIISRAKACDIKVSKFAQAELPSEYAEVAVEMFQILANLEQAAKIKTSQRNALPNSAFGVPGKRKFPLDTCGRVRNAMARFNQAKGLSSTEKATLRRKILARAHACGIEVKKFGKASTDMEFAEVLKELIAMEAPKISERNIVEDYAAETKKKGPCPPGMEWDPKAKKCGKMMGFFKHVTQADALKTSEEPRMLQPEGRRDTVNHACPPNHLFDYKRRKCIPLNKDTVLKGTDTAPDTMGDAVMKGSTEEGQQRVLTPSPKGKPDKISQDCPKGTIWQQWTQKCIPLDPRKKIASEEADFDAKNREGLVDAPAGKVKTPYDCPAGTMWDGKLKVCKPLDPADKIRDGGKDLDPKDFAGFSVNKVISELDKVITSENMKASGSTVVAKDLPNAAFPPSLVSSTKRSLMHHTAEATDPYDTTSVDIVRLRNALARISTVEEFSSKAVEDALEHLLFHAREVLNVKK